MSATGTERLPVLLVTSNGVGMGHLTRQLCVALARDDLAVTVLSLSGAVPSVARAVARGDLPEAAGIAWEFCPSRTSPWQRGGLARVAWRTAWDGYFADRLRLLVAETGARVVVFDGVVPYAGLLAARRELPSTAFVWLRRGFWRDGVGAAWLAHSSAFDVVIEPGDVAGDFDTGPTSTRDDAVRTAPVSLTEQLRLDEAAAAKAALGLDPDRPALLLAPGSGAYADVSALVGRVLERVRASGTDWQIALTRQAIARAIASGKDEESDDVVVLRDVYPLARHLRGFDAAVAAAGYNAVHEHTAVGLPTLFVPSTAHETDDQVARAEALASLGTALVARDDVALDAGIDELLDPATRDRLSAACARTPRADGASTIAALVHDLAVPRTPAPWPARTGPGPGRRLVASALARRRGVPIHTRDIADVDALRDPPVEQALATASRDYLRGREQAERWLYRSS